jgi:hypothetical protein
VDEKIVIRPRARYFSLAISLLIGLGFLVTSADATQAQKALPAILGFWLISYALLAKPKVVMTAGFIKIVNPFSAINASWAAVEEIGVNYSGFISIAGKKYSVFAAIAPNRYHSRRLTKGDLRGSGYENDPTVSARLSPQSESGEFYLIANRFWSENLEPTAQSEATLNWPIILGTLILSGAALIILLS